jgi:hypothetical protein
MNATTATPVQIDTELAALHTALADNAKRRQSAINSLHTTAGSRVYQQPTWTDRKGGYRNTMTDEQAINLVTEALAAAIAGTYEGPLRTYELVYGGTARVLESLPGFDAEEARLLAEAAPLEQEFAARWWSRFFLVTSSDGHIHSSMSCSSCRPTTTYGWLPNMSGMTQEQAMDALDEMGPGRSALCSVCFPDAPVAAKRTKVTKAKAAKLAA